MDFLAFDEQTRIGEGSAFERRGLARTSPSLMRISRIKNMIENNSYHLLSSSDYDIISACLAYVVTLETLLHEPISQEQTSDSGDST